MEYITWFITEYGGYVKIGLVVILCFIFFLMMYLFAAAAIKDRYEFAREQLRKGLSQYMRETKWNFFNYYYLQKFLDNVGATYYSKGAVTPLVFMSYKLLSLIVGFLVGLIFHPVLGVLIAMIAFTLPNRRMKKRNDKDNEAMMRDIMSIYDVVLLQTNSGVYIAQILIDAYMVVENMRLKSALLELTGKIKETNDVRTSLDVFSNRFANEHIENLAVAIGQSVETGNSARMLSDIKRHMVNLQKSYNKLEQMRVKRCGNVFKIAVFIAVMLVLVYGCVLGLFGAVMGLGL